MSTLAERQFSWGKAPSLLRRAAVYRAFLRNSFLMMLAYRLRYFTGILTYLLFVSVHYFIWQAVYAAKEMGAQINGFTLSEMVTYISIGWIARSLYFSSIDSDIDDLVKTGQISVYLLRPVHFHTMMFCQAAGESLFRLFFFTAPISLVIISVFPVSLPNSLFNLLLFFVASLFSFLISTEINFIVGMLAFSLKSVEGIIRAKYFLIQLLSGLLLPLTFFPSWMQMILDLLPFKMITFVPLQIYLGKVPSERLPFLFLGQVLWLVVLVMVGQLLWKKELTELTLQGG